MRAQREQAGGTPGRVVRPATIYDVAAEAGVSHQTVSRFLRGYEGIRPQTRERVMAALSSLDYRPNLAARGLKSGRSHRIGALTHEVVQVGPSRIAESASAAAREAGYILDLISVDTRDPRAIDEALVQLTQHSPAGVLVLASTDEMLTALTKADIRVPMHLETELDDPTSPSETGVPALVEHLAALGHTRFMLIAGPPKWSAARRREHAYESALEQLRLPTGPILHGDWSAASGYRAIADAASPFPATAVLAANDQMALGAMLALKERGLAVPGDVSVVGIDDNPEAAYYDPPLTTVHLDFEATGRHAVTTLVARIEEKEIPGRLARHPRLVVRRSSGPVPALIG